MFQGQGCVQQPVLLPWAGDQLHGNRATLVKASHGDRQRWQPEYVEQCGVADIARIAQGMAMFGGNAGEHR